MGDMRGGRGMAMGDMRGRRDGDGGYDWGAGAGAGTGARPYGMPMIARRGRPLCLPLANRGGWDMIGGRAGRANKQRNIPPDSVFSSREHI